MSHELWHADIAVTEQIVRASIADQFPELMPMTTLQFLGEGWDNKAYLVNNQLIFRFPRRQIAVAGMEQENRLLNHIHTKVSLDMPKLTYIAHPSAYYPYPFHGYLMIKGQSGSHAQLTACERVASLIPLAQFLKQLHTTSKKQAVAMGASPPVFDRTHIDNVISQLKERVDKLIARHWVIDKNGLHDEIRAIEKIELSSDDKVLTHGDLHCGHLLFNQGQLTGIIDWGDIGINNRAVDLAIVFTFYPNHCHQDFIDIYGPVEPNAWRYARFLGLYCSLTSLLYAHDTGDKLLVTEAANSVRRINSHLITG